MMTGVDTVHVSYRGIGPAVTALLAGDVQVMFDGLPSSIEHIKSGKFRALGRDFSDAIGTVAGYTNRSRFRTGLRSKRMVRPKRSKESAA
jgi:hypothetical protein